MNTGDGGPGQAAAFIPQYGGKYGKINGDVYVNAGQGDNFEPPPGMAVRKRTKAQARK